MKPKVYRFIHYIFLLLSLASNSYPAVPAKFHIEHLGTLGGNESQATSINEQGTIVGWSHASNGAQRAFRWTPSGGMKSLGNSGVSSQANDINNLGQIVGRLATTNDRAFLWTGEMIDLGTFDSATRLEAAGINDSGKIVGHYWHTNQPGFYKGFIWDHGVFVTLPELAAHTTRGWRINDSGNIAGFSNTRANDRRVVAWFDSGTYLRHPTNTTQEGEATAINKNNQLVGSLSYGVGPILWDGTNVIKLGAPGAARDISDLGWVVGEIVFSGHSGTRAFLWVDENLNKLAEQSEIKDLNTLIPQNSGWILSSATAVNNFGMIAGYGQFQGKTRAFALIPEIEKPAVPLLFPTETALTTPQVAIDVIEPSSKLLLYNRNLHSFQPDTSPFERDKMTIVLTHGWLSNPNTWAENFAREIAQAGVSANILAWDWTENASTFLFKATSATMEEAERMTVSLKTLLTPGYSHPIHFVGHSLGTLLNGQALNHLHGDLPGGIQFIDPLRTHVTIFDDSGLSLNLLETLPFNRISPTSIKAVPMRSAWVDNYISAIGALHKNAVNIILKRGIPTDADGISSFKQQLTQYHGYPYEWYTKTLPPNSESPLGFKWSFERNGIASAPVLGSVYIQATSGDELQLLPVSWDEAEQSLDDRLKQFEQINEQVLGGEVSPVIFVNGVGTINLVFEIVEGIGRWVLQTTFRPEGQTGLQAPQMELSSTQGNQFANGSAAIFIPITVPQNATGITFEFLLSNVSNGSYFVFGIDQNNLFSAKPQSFNDGSLLSTGHINISDWAGKSATLYFGLVNAQSTNHMVTISRIAFVTLENPHLTIARKENINELNWPIVFSEFKLEYSNDIQSGEWTPITDPIPISNSSFSFTNQPSAAMNFFRLRKN